MREQRTGETLYAFRWKKIAAIIGDVLAREREMMLFVRDRRDVVVERKDYRKPAFS